MNPSFKKLWTDALESGEYTQAEGVLYDGEGNHCCLGVLRHVVTGRNRGCDDLVELDYPVDPTEGTFLNERFEKKVGINKEVQCKLSKMNDAKVPFNEIATWIKKYL